MGRFNAQDPLGDTGGDHDLYDDDYKSGKMSGWDYTKSIGLGAATGAMSTLGPGIVGGALTGGAAAAINDAGDQYITKGEVDLKQTAIAGSVGVGTGVISGAAGAFGKNVIKNEEIIGKKLPLPPLKDYGVPSGIAADVAGNTASVVLEGATPAADNQGTTKREDHPTRDQR
ncbi:MAG: hypothetical protein AB1916_05335 [Thermodesulfobacteriota bacterium]